VSSFVGRGGMCDDVRAVVAGLGRAGKTTFELEADAFSW
jgi:predicted YcjX-like family ATPase